MSTISRLGNQIHLKKEHPTEEPTDNIANNKTANVAKSYLNLAGFGSPSSSTSGSSTPKKKKVHSLLVPPTPSKKAKIISSSLELHIGQPLALPSWKKGEKLTVIPQKKLGEGQSSAAWLVTLNSGPQKVLQLFHRNNVLERKLEFDEYKKLRAIDFSVAIHDDLEYFRDHEEEEPSFTYGYHLREYIPDLFPEFGELETDHPLYAQVKELMKTLLDNQIASDFKRTNVGIKDDQVVYFDLMPDKEESFKVLLRPYAETFAAKGSKLYNELISLSNES